MNPFLASELPPSPPDQADIHIIPAPMELSVSYGKGARLGPAAILAASDQLEARETPNLRIYTQKPLAAKCKTPEKWIDTLEAQCAYALACGAAPFTLGGEHTVTLGAAKAIKAALGEKAKVGILHFDAHADLRDTYEGSALSHACVMRRVHELGFPILQFATRAYSAEEADYRAVHRKTLTAYDATDIAHGALERPFIPKAFPKLVYVSFDLDAFDPSLMPATGTPVPGGLQWFDALDILQTVLEGRTLVGADIVELAPVKGLHHCDFTAARLVQELMTYLPEPCNGSCGSCQGHCH